MQTDICMPDYEMADQEIQTDFVELCSTDAQTDTIELCTVAIQTECNQVSEAQNLLTPVSNSLPISLPLIYFYMMKLESIEHLCKCLSSIKSIENWFLEIDLVCEVCVYVCVSVCLSVCLCLCVCPRPRG